MLLEQCHTHAHPVKRIARQKPRNKVLSREEGRLISASLGRSKQPVFPETHHPELAPWMP